MNKETLVKMEEWKMITLKVRNGHMGLTAEKLVTQREFTKEDMDRWGTRAHQLASKAYKEGFFKDEIRSIGFAGVDPTIIEREP